MPEDNVKKEVNGQELSHIDYKVKASLITEAKNAPNTVLTNDLENLNINGCKKKNGRFAENTSRKRLGKEARLKSLQALKGCPEDQIEGLFVSKVRLCATVNSCQDIYFEKLQTLNELTKFICDYRIIPPRVYPEIVSMFSANVFRTLPPPSVPFTNEIDSEEEDMSNVYSDNLEWQCLQNVYELFLAFLECRHFDPSACKPYIKQKFVVSLLLVFESENPHERMHLKSILHKIYQLFLALRPFIRRQMTYVFQTFVYETDRHSGISDLLDVVMSIVDGFVVPLKEEHKRFLKKSLLPLHTPSSFPRYSLTLMYVVSRYLEKDPSLTELVIKALLKYWPKGNSAKELLFLFEFEEFLCLSPDILQEMKKIKAPILRQLASCATCSHIQLSERAMYILKSEEVQFLITPID